MTGRGPDGSLYRLRIWEMGGEAGKPVGPFLSGGTPGEGQEITEVSGGILVLHDAVLRQAGLGARFGFRLIGEPGARNGAEET